jgi:hypothetical protein
MTTNAAVAMKITFFIRAPFPAKMVFCGGAREKFF